jgi:hypothetical protein
LFIFFGVIVLLTSFLGSLAVYKNWRLFLILNIYTAFLFTFMVATIATIIFGLFADDMLLIQARKFYGIVFASADGTKPFIDALNGWQENVSALSGYLNFPPK